MGSPTAWHRKHVPLNSRPVEGVRLLMETDNENVTGLPALVPEANCLSFEERQKEKSKSR
jgi:hypothetical protein